MGSLNLYQTPVPLVDGVSVTLTLRYEGECWTEEDMRVVAQRVCEAMESERKYLEAQRRGDVPARKPNPCGCGGYGS